LAAILKVILQKMRIIILSFLFSFFLGCNSESVGKKQFVGYDQLVHYKINIDDADIYNIEQKAAKSKLELLKTDLIINEVPISIVDTSFISNLRNIGFEKNIISANNFKEINEIFYKKEKKGFSSSKCAPIYRDILVFKKLKKTIGIAKICFECMQSQIVGDELNGEYYGQSSDYKKLDKILKK
jgi:hypothetical protein